MISFDIRKKHTYPKDGVYQIIKANLLFNQWLALWVRFMETTEKVVESYCRYVKQWFTIPNIRCKGQYEIDLLAISSSVSGEIERYHMECGVSISGSFSKLTAKPFSSEELKQRVGGPAQRRTLGYFIERKFDVPEVQETLTKYGFTPGKYHRIIVTWDATEKAHTQAEQQGIEIWYFPELLHEIADAHQTHRAYLIDDTARTIQLFAMAKKWLTKTSA